jgi:DNA-binding transcriptional LysR family regulator
MDVRFIQTLLTVVEAGSFAGAALRENLTPAAVAQRVRRLEADLNQRLIIRAGHQVAPTPECLSILPRLRHITQQVGHIASDLGSTGLSGPVRLGAISTALSDRIPNVLAQFARHLPSASLSFVPGTSGDLYARLLDEDIDAAFVVRPPFKIPKSIQCVQIETQPFVMIVAAEDDRPVDRILATDRALIYDPSSWGGRLVMPWIKKWVPHDRILCELDALEAIAIAVGRGVGYSIVPDWKGLASLALVRRIPLRDHTRNRELVLLHRQLNAAGVQLFQA